MIRRFGTPPQRGHVYPARPGSYGLLVRGGRVLLAWQGAPYDELLLPGGGIDPGESPVRALHREVMEETGWLIARPRKLGTYRRFTYMPDYDRNAEKVCHIYLATPVRRLGPPSEPDHTAIWMDLDEAAAHLTSLGDRAFAAALARQLALPHR